MKCVIIFLLFIPFTLVGQGSKRDVLDPNRLEEKEYLLEAEKIAPAEIKLPFQSIKIIDSRFDTSKFGYVPVVNILTGKKKAFKKFVIRGGNANGIERYYNDYFADAFVRNGFELLIVMKRFWISGEAKSNNKRVEVANSVRDGNNIYCKWEYYLGKDGKYLPVKRLDTVILIDEDFDRYINEELTEKREPSFKFALKALIEILDYSNAVKHFNTQPKKSLEEIAEFNKKMNFIPVLQESVLKKGVYLSFEEFKNNQPSIIDFQEKKMRYGKINTNTEIYLEDMKGQTISYYWGYSDGKDFRYGMLGNDKIFRTHNTFCFFIKVVGYTITTNNRVYRNNNNNTLSKNKYELWTPFQIDMETGDIY